MKTKKLFMSLGTIAAVAAPVVSTISCGTMLSSSKADGPKVGWDDSKRTIYFNLFNNSKTMQEGSLEPFIEAKEGASSISGRIPTLEIAQKWEDVAGYTVNKLGHFENRNNSRKIKDGEIVHVVMGAQHFVWKEPDDLHSTRWRSPVGYHLRFSFPFHTLEDMALDVNAVNDIKALEFYQAFKPWNIHTNFWKALNIIFTNKLGTTASHNTIDIVNEAGATVSAAAQLSSESEFKKNPEKSQTSADTNLILWNTSIGIESDTNKTEAVYQMYHNKEIALTETEITKIYDQSVPQPH